MNGILVIDKKEGYTSRDVVNKVSSFLNTKKIGHTGTLDPLATGVLVLCVGKATRLSELVTAYDKEYFASVVLGLSTDTLDVTGTVLKEENVYIEKEKIEKVLSLFQKTYMQKVPIYSAVKIKGKKLYEYARENKDVEIPSRMVTIFSTHLEGDVLYQDGKTIFTFSCKVSKGTYIRSLISDIASSLGTIGCMQSLHRTRQGNYSIENAYTLEDIENQNFTFQSIETALLSYTKIKVDKKLEEKILNGCVLENIYQTEYPLFVREDDSLLALYRPYHGNLIKPFKMLFK